MTQDLRHARAASAPDLAGPAVSPGLRHIALHVAGANGRLRLPPVIGPFAPRLTVSEAGCFLAAGSSLETHPVSRRKFPQFIAIPVPGTTRSQHGE